MAQTLDDFLQEVQEELVRFEKRWREEHAKNPEEYPLEEARCLRFAAALVDIMTGMPDQDIQVETGLPQENCDKIAKARSDAKTLLRHKMEQTNDGNYTNKNGYKMQREYGLTSDGIDINGRWVLRGPNEEWIDCDYYRNDLLERHGFVID